MVPMGPPLMSPPGVLPPRPFPGRLYRSVTTPRRRRRRRRRRRSPPRVVSSVVRGYSGPSSPPPPVGERAWGVHVSTHPSPDPARTRTPTHRRRHSPGVGTRGESGPGGDDPSTVTDREERILPTDRRKERKGGSRKHNPKRSPQTRRKRRGDQGSLRSPELPPRPVSHAPSRTGPHSPTPPRPPSPILTSVTILGSSTYLQRNEWTARRGRGPEGDPAGGRHESFSRGSRAPLELPSRPLTNPRRSPADAKWIPSGQVEDRIRGGRVTGPEEGPSRPFVDSLTSSFTSNETKP